MGKGNLADFVQNRFHRGVLIDLLRCKWAPVNAPFHVRRSSSFDGDSDRRCKLIGINGPISFAGCAGEWPGGSSLFRCRSFARRIQDGRRRKWHFRIESKNRLHSRSGPKQTFESISCSRLLHILIFPLELHT